MTQPLGELLVAAGLITEAQLTEANQQGTGFDLPSALTRLGILRSDNLVQFMADSFNLEIASSHRLTSVDHAVIGLLPADLAHMYRAVPLSRANGQLEVAFSDPSNRGAVEEISFFTGLQVRSLAAAPEPIQRLLELHYPTVSGAAQLSPGPEPERLAWQIPQASPPLPLDFSDVTRQLESAADSDAIADLLLSFAQRYLKRAAIFVTKQGMVVGWDGVGDGLSKERIRGILIPLDAPSIFAMTNDSKIFFYGEMPETPINRRFLSAMGDLKPTRSLLFPIVVGSKTICFLYGDNAAQSPERQRIDELHRLAERAAEAFARVIQTAKQQRGLRAV